MTFSVKTVAPILRLLQDRAWSVPELVEETGISKETARTLFRTLHAEGLIYVQYWTLMGSYWSPSYRWGMNPDAEKVRPKRARKLKPSSFDPFYNMCRP